jgi:hypothetical protein
LGEPLQHVEKPQASARRTKRAMAQPALILAGHGISLRVENGALTIQNGFTHYPQKVSLTRIVWKGDIVCAAGASGYSANPFRAKWQLETREDPTKRKEFCRSIMPADFLPDGINYPEKI